MSARAFWKARVCAGDQRIPVGLFAAVQDSAIHFRLLHAADHAPVKQQMVDPLRDRVVDADEIQRGLEVDRGVYVILTEDERAALAPEPSREITVEQVVDAAAIDLRWFLRPYYLAPDGDVDGYFALAEALAERDAFAIVRWVMRGKRYQGALFSREGYLVLATLRHAEEVVELPAVRPAPGRDPDEKELGLARQLIGALEGELDLDDYRDEYRERLVELVESKAAGRPVKMPEAPAPEAGGSLLEALEASVRAGRKVARG